jgi:hypothetical protein
VVFQIGVAPRRIDVMTSVEAIAFEDAWPERLEIELEGVSVPVVGRAHFIQGERATGRTKDQSDAEALEENDGNVPE